MSHRYDGHGGGAAAVDVSTVGPGSRTDGSWWLGARTGGARGRTEVAPGATLLGLEEAVEVGRRPGDGDGGGSPAGVCRRRRQVRRVRPAHVVQPLRLPVEGAPRDDPPPVLVALRPPGYQLVLQQRGDRLVSLVQLGEEVLEGVRKVREGVDRW